MAKKKRVITPIYPYDPLADNHDESAVEEVAEIKKTNRVNDFAFISLAVFATACTLFFFTFAIQMLRSYRISGEEYNELRYLAAAVEAEADIQPPAPALHISALDMMMSEINADFICWIRIEGTRIDYPVVRAGDNETYLHLTFAGTENAHGAIFMDYRNFGDFVPHIIIYGHNTRHGNMFTDLHRFLDTDFKARHPYITIIVNDRIVRYEIFSARRTDVYDPAFFLDFSEAGAFHAFLGRINAPEDAAQVITLSTCVSAGNDAERMVVQGVLRNTY